MYTTLETLKFASACTGGYGRMLAFFTTRVKFKKMPIPLWMVGMVGNHSDMEWAVQHGMIVDEKTFAEFRKRTILSVLKHLFWSFAKRNWRIEKNKHVVDAFNDIVTCDTPEKAEALLAKWRAYHFGHQLWNNVLEADVWTSPHKYINYVLDHQSSTASMTHRQMCSVTTDDRYFPYAPMMSAEENFARLCLNGNDPYAALVDMLTVTSLSVNRGVQINTFEEGGEKKFMATISITDPRRIFQLAHSLNSQDISVLDITGVNDLINKAETLVSEVGNLTEDDQGIIEAVKKMSVISDDRSLRMPSALTAQPAPLNVTRTTRNRDDDEDDEEDTDPVAARRSRTSTARRNNDAYETNPPRGPVTRTSERLAALRTARRDTDEEEETEESDA